MDAQIVLGKVTAATAHFVDLLVRLGFVRNASDAAQTRANTAAI